MKCWMIYISTIDDSIWFSGILKKVCINQNLLLPKETSIRTFGYDIGVSLNNTNLNIRMILVEKNDRKLILMIDNFHLLMDQKTGIKLLCRCSVRILVYNFLGWVIFLQDLNNSTNAHCILWAWKYYIYIFDTNKFFGPTSTS